MKNILILILITSTIIADIDISFQEDAMEFNPKQIVSIEIGGGSIKRVQADTISGSSSIDRSMFFGGIKLGSEDIGLRLFLSYRLAEIDSIIAHSFGLELDSIIDLSTNFAFFYGLNVGAILYEIVDKNSSSDYTTDATPYYGIEAGLIYKLSDKHELEFGGRFSVTNLNSESADKSYIFDQLINYYLAYNFKY